MRTRHVVMLVIGCLLLLPGLGLLIGGGAIGIFEATTRDSGGWHSVTIDRLASTGVAVTSPQSVVRLDGPSTVVDRLDLQLRMAVTPTDGVNPVFVGVAPSSDLDQYLAGAAHDQVVRLGTNGVVTTQAVPGSGSVQPPGTQTFWAAKASGTGTQTLTWTATSGSWSIAVLNASGQPGVTTTAVVGVRSSALVPIAIVMMVVGLVMFVAGVLLVVAGVRGSDRDRSAAGAPPPTGTPVATGAVPTDASTHPESLPPPGAPPGDAFLGAVVPTREHPVVLEARIAPDLSRWMWLVKWFLAIPHFIVLLALWIAFGVTTVIAWFAILFTARYPRGLFAFNVGVMRWSWRVMHYCSTGGLGTDRYPEFSLDPQPGDDARLDIAYPERLSRGLIFVKWLLLLPHWIVLALIAGTQSHTNENGVRVGGWPGVLSILVFVAGLVLLFSGTMPRGLFDVVIGLNRWVYRVMAYAALMTDMYPPFRFDAGGSEALPQPPPPTGPPADAFAPPPPPPPQPPPPDAPVEPQPADPRAAEPQPAHQPDVWHRTPSE